MNFEFIKRCLKQLFSQGVESVYYYEFAYGAERELIEGLTAIYDGETDKIRVLDKKESGVVFTFKVEDCIDVELYPPYAVFKHVDLIDVGGSDRIGELYDSTIRFHNGGEQA